MNDFEKDDPKKREEAWDELRTEQDAVQDAPAEDAQTAAEITAEAREVTEPTESAEAAEQAEAAAEAEPKKAEAEQETPQQGGPCVREYRYEEKVKKTPRRKRMWAKFVAGCLIVGISGGTFFGAGYGAVQHLFHATPTVSTTMTNIEKTAGVTGGYTAAEIVKAVKPSVVSISTTMTGTTQYFGKFSVPYEAEGAGSGVIFYSDEDKIAIVTNNHVIEGANSIYVTLEGDISLPAKVLSTKSESDLAVLAVSWDDLKEAGVTEVTTAVFGDSDALEVGDSVIAIGNAMGQGISATDGIISMKEQQINVDGKSLTVLQTSAAINSGNSGGALVNSKGEVIGINTAKYNSSMAEGMGYAIPSNVVTPIAEALLADGTQPKAYIGIKGTDASLYNLPVGALIVEVEEDGPAADAGLQVSDIITVYDGQSVSDMNTLVELVNNTEIGKTVDITIVRDGKENLDLKLKIADKNS